MAVIYECRWTRGQQILDYIRTSYSMISHQKYYSVVQWNSKISPIKSETRFFCAILVKTSLPVKSEIYSAMAYESAQSHNKSKQWIMRQTEPFEHKFKYKYLTGTVCNTRLYYFSFDCLYVLVYTKIGRSLSLVIGHCFE